MAARSAPQALAIPMLLRWNKGSVDRVYCARSLIKEHFP